MIDYSLRIEVDLYYACFYYSTVITLRVFKSFKMSTVTPNFKLPFPPHKFAWLPYTYSTTLLLE